MNYIPELDVTVYTRLGYNRECISRIARIIKRDGRFGHDDPEPMGDCVIIERDMPPAGISTVLTWPGPKYRVKIGECYTGFDEYRMALAFVAAVRRGDAS